MFSQSIHRYLFLFGCCTLMCGMMLGAILTSIPQFIIVGNWLLEGDFKNKWLKLKTNKFFWVVISVFFIHVVGLLYSQNISDGLNDLQIKLPLLLLPIVFFSTKPPSLNEFYLLLYCFLLGCVINTVWCYIYSFILHKNETIRHVSRYMNHIRLGLYLNMAICCCVYFIKQNTSRLIKALFYFLILYYVFALYALGLASGIFTLFLLLIIFVMIVIFKQKLIFKGLAVITLIVSVFFITNYIKSIYNFQFTLNATAVNVPIHSSKNYWDTVINYQKENGNLVFININEFELKQQWKKRFNADSFDYSTRHNINRYYILLRYLASKGLTKDSVGVSKLLPQDFENIKNNITNYLYPSWGNLHKRIYELVIEYDEFKNNRSINGHSLTMRLYFWQAAFKVIKNNPLIGVGTGDVQQQLNETYITTKSPLSAEWYKRPHNQFITITVALGIFGLLIFVSSIIYPVLKLRNQLTVLYFPFLIILISSFMLEDTLESQAGLSFFVVFNTLFISLAYNKVKS